MQTTEQDVVAKAGSLEEMSLHTLEADRSLRQQAPPVDWDAIAEEGAQRYWAQWDAEPGQLLAPASDHWDASPLGPSSFAGWHMHWLQAVAAPLLRQFKAIFPEINQVREGEENRQGGPEEEMSGPSQLFCTAYLP